MSTLLCIAIQIDLSRYCPAMPEKLLYIISGTRYGFESISLAIRDIIALICSLLLLLYVELEEMSSVCRSCQLLDVNIVYRH